MSRLLRTWIALLATVSLVSITAASSRQTVDARLMEARRILERATQTVAPLDNRQDSSATDRLDALKRRFLIAEIAGAQARAGDLMGAFKTARGDERALAAIVGVQAKTGDYDSALKTADRIPDGETRFYAVCEVITAKARAKDFVGARKILDTKIQTFDPLVVAYLLKEIAKLQAKAGDFPGALKTAEPVQEPMILAFIAGAQAKAGDQTGAEKTLQQAIKTPPEFASRAAEVAWYAIAQGQAMAGDMQGALKSAMAVEEGDRRAEALLIVATAQTKGHNVAGALKVAEAIQVRPIKAFVLAEIAAAQAEVGDRAGAATTLPMAIQVTTSIKDTGYRVAALRRIGEAQAKIGSKDEAARTFQQVLEFALTTAESRVKAEQLHILAKTQVRLGEFQGALKAARAIGPEMDRAIALADIASAQAVANPDEARKMFEEARKAALSEKDDRAKADAIRVVARAQAKAGNVKEALGWAEKLAAPELKTYALLGAAQGLLAQVYPEPPVEEEPFRIASVP